MKGTLAAAAVGSIVGLSHHARAEDYGVDLAAQARGGLSRAGAVMADGVTTVFNFGPQLVVYNATNVNLPVKQGSVLLSQIPEDIKINGSYAYAALGTDGIAVVSLAVPGNPTLTSIVSISGGGAYDLHVSGTKMFVAGGDAGLVVFDVSNPANPVAHGSFNPVETIKRVGGFGNYATFVRGNNQVQIADTTNIDSPVARGSIAVLSPGDIEMRLLYAYVLDGDGDLRTINFSNLDVPVQTNLDHPSGFPISLAASGNTLAIGSSAGLEVFNIFNPADPVAKSVLPQLGAVPGEVVLNGARSFAVFQKFVEFADLTNQSNPLEKGYVGTPGPVSCMCSQGSLAYLGTPAKGLIVMDCVNPEKPIEIGQLGLPTWVEVADMVVDGNYLYLAERATLSGLDSKVRVISLANPALPITASWVVPQPENQFTGIAKIGNIVGATTGDHLFLIDISNPQSAVVKGSYPLPVWCDGLKAVGSYFAASCRENGVLLINPANPMNPTLAGFIPASPKVRCIAADGTRLAVADQVSTIIYDIQPGGVQNLVSILSTDLQPNGMSIVNDRIDLINKTDGYRAIDFSSPGSPIEIAHFDTPGDGLHVCATPEQALVSDGNGGAYWFAFCGGGADLNCDGAVDGADLGLLLAAWGSSCSPGEASMDCPDLNGDGAVNGADLGILLAAWG